MADNEQVASNRDKVLGRLKERYPDQDFADDEALYGKIDADYADYADQLAGYQDREKSLTDLFASNPQSAAFLTDWRKGEDPIVGLIRKFGPELKEALEDPEKQEAIAEANRQYAERVAKSKEYDDEYQKNMTEKTLPMIEQLKEEEGLSDEQIDEAFAFLEGIIHDGLVGLFTPENVHMAMKALNHDNDVATADREGEVRGRNANIEEKLRRSGRGDGTADLAGKNGGGADTGRAMPELGAIEDNYGTQNIWERGGERRSRAIG